MTKNVTLHIISYILYIYIVLNECSTFFIVCLPSTVLYMFFCLRPFYCTVSHKYEEELPHPRSTPWGAYRSVSHTFSAATLHHMPSQPYIPNIPHPRQVEIGGWACSDSPHVFFLCTCHIGTTVHTWAFYEFQTTEGNLYMLIPQVYQLLAVEQSRAWYGHRSCRLRNGNSQDGHLSKY